MPIRDEDETKLGDFDEVNGVAAESVPQMRQPRARIRRE